MTADEFTLLCCCVINFVFYLLTYLLTYLVTTCCINCIFIHQLAAQESNVATE